MIHWFKVIVLLLTIAGSLGLFLYGMKLMSESIMKAAGTRLRSTVSGITADRWRGILTGFVSTGILQSSTATTILTVSLVHAGLISLPASISLIMGANIGTTVTGWLVSLIGFNLKMTTLSLVIIAIAIPVYLAGKRRSKNWAEFMIGFAMLFIGLQLLQDSSPDIHNNPGIIHWLTSLSTRFDAASFLFLLAGIILTMIVQSSSAIMSLVLVMASGGLIPFYDAAGMIIGVNIGTTISVNLAALMANREARIAARSHFLFNLAGALWAFPLLHQMADAISFMITRSGNPSPLVVASAMPIGLAIFHSLFNVVNTLLLISFIPQIQRISSKLVFIKEDKQKKNTHLAFIERGILSTSEIALVQVKKELENIFNHASDSLRKIPAMLSVKDPAEYKKLFQKIKKNEKETDRSELEINHFLSSIASGNISHSANLEIRKMVKIVDELETITDYCLHMASAIDQKNRDKIWFTQELRDKLNTMVDKVGMLLSLTEETYKQKTKLEEVLPEAKRIEEDINYFRNEYRDQHLAMSQKQEYPYQAGITFLHLVNSAEKIGDHCMNILEAMTGMNT